MLSELSGKVSDKRPRRSRIMRSSRGGGGRPFLFMDIQPTMSLKARTVSGSKGEAVMVRLQNRGLSKNFGMDFNDTALLFS